MPLFCLQLLAVHPKFWITSSFKDFSKGKLKGLSVQADGSLFLARKFKTILKSQQALIWSAVYDKNNNLYIGTGHEGKVLKINSSGESSILMDATEIDVLALAIDSEENIYAATSPNGKIYKIDYKGQVSVFFDPPDKFIWDLEFGTEGSLYVATGGSGKIYKVDGKGNGKEFYDLDQTNVTCLAVDSNNNVLAGTDPEGYVYRINPGGDGFVLHNSGMNEIHDIQVNALDEIFFIAVSEITSETPSSVQEVGRDRLSIENISKSPLFSSTAQTEITVEFDSRRSTGSINSPGKSSKVKSSLNRIGDDYSVRTLWSSDHEIAYGLYLDDHGNIFFSSGKNGKIYSLSNKEELTLLMETTEEEITLLIPVGKDLLACSSNMATIYQLKNQLNTRGIYESEVRDTQFLSTWGSLSWRVELPKGTSIKVLTRTGNTERPGKSWSNWLRVKDQLEAANIQSPKARYIQYKIILETRTKFSPKLREVIVPFLQQNIAPKIESINILPAGLAFLEIPKAFVNQVQLSSSDQVASEITGAALQISNNSIRELPSQKIFRKGAQSFTWEVDDPNDDTLTYSIFFRGENEDKWKLLEENYKRLNFTLESGTIPDGRYLIKIVASDIINNPFSSARSGGLISQPFNIDNTPPKFTVLSRKMKGSKGIFRFRVIDGSSGLRKAEYAMNGGNWQAVFSKDGVLDSKSEEFEITTKSLDEGEHIVALRVFDAMGNVAIGKSTVSIK